MISYKTIFILLFFSFTTLAEVTVKLVTEEGKQRLVASEPQVIAKNCNGEIQEAIKNRLNWMYEGNYESLSNIYVKNAVINYSSSVFNKRPNRESYIFPNYIEKLKKSMIKQDQYLYLQLNGECKNKDADVIYIGKEVEKLQIEGFGPLIAITDLKLLFTKTNKIKSEKQQVNIQQWNDTSPNTVSEPE